MKVSVKNMVCPRCVSSVRRIAVSCGIEPQAVTLGCCEFSCDPGPDFMERFRISLEAEGFELLTSREQKIVEDVKSSLVDLVYNRPENLPSLNLSEYLQQRLAMSYSLVRNVFSSLEGRSIENYFISLRIERAKELVRYGELTLSEIADRLGYSSPAHLSSQFKKVTGLTPSQFRLNLGRRNNIDSI